jgi:SAM-dependent methyltransferase
MNTPASPEKDNMNEERFRPPTNTGPGKGVLGFLRGLARRILDLQVHTVMTDLSAWLRGREGRVLEVGCGCQPYRHMLPSRCRYQGLDWAMASENFNCQAKDVRFYDGGVFPFGDASFDNVFHTEVIEHVPDAQAFLCECRRVLKSGGVLFLSVPFQARYHFIPHDYWRFTPSGLRLLLTRAGFSDIAVKPRGTDLTVAAYKTVSLTYRWLSGGIAGKCLGILSLPLGCAALLVAHVSLAFALGSSDDCLGYSVTAKAV